MARDLSEILPDLLEDGYPIKAETRNIEYLSAKTKYYQNKKGVSSLARYVGQEGYTLLYIYCMMHLLKMPMHHFSYKDLLHHFLSILDDDTVIAGVNLLTIDVESLGSIFTYWNRNNRNNSCSCCHPSCSIIHYQRDNATIFNCHQSTIRTIIHRPERREFCLLIRF